MSSPFDRQLEAVRKVFDASDDQLAQLQRVMAELDGATDRGPFNAYPSSPGEFAARWNSWSHEERSLWVAAASAAFQTAELCNVRHGRENLLAAELRTMEPFFTRVTDLQRYMVATAAAADETGTCDCEVTREGIYRLAARCIPTGPADPPPDHCRTLTHLTARTLLDGLKLPTAQLSDPQLDTAIAQMAALVDQAPGLTQRRFVIELQTVLRASLAPLAVGATATADEETTTQ